MKTGEFCFTGTELRKIDASGRVILPQSWRTQFQGSGYVIQTVEDVGTSNLCYLELAPECAGIQRISEGTPSQVAHIDRQGRMMLPPNCIKFLADRDNFDEVMLVGDFNVGTVWARSEWANAKNLGFLVVNSSNQLYR